MAEMQKYRVAKSGERDLSFTGELINSVNSITPNNDSRYSELSLYRTKAGKFVFQREHVTRWQGETSNYSAVVYNSIKDMVEDIKSEGVSALEKRLFSEDVINCFPGLECLVVEEVE